MITDLTKEHPDKILWRFLLPLMISVIFQQFYNIADSMIAGKFAGESALGAVGASYPITIIYMAFAVGMNLGASVVISRLFGAGDKAGLRRAVSTAFISVLVLSVLLSVFGYFCSGAMMRWIHTPEDIMADGVLYLKIYVYGLSFLLFYNVCTGIFTALGDSKTPLYFMISIKLMADGIIRGSGAMAYFVAATVPDLILRIGFAHLLTPKFGSTGIWMAWPFGWFAATALTILFYRKVIENCNLRE